MITVPTVTTGKDSSMKTEEERKTPLIGDILEYGLHEEADLIPLSLCQLIGVLQQLHKLKECIYG